MKRLIGLLHEGLLDDDLLSLVTIDIPDFEKNDVIRRVLQARQTNKIIDDLYKYRLWTGDSRETKQESMQVIFPYLIASIVLNVIPVRDYCLDLLMCNDVLSADDIKNKLSIVIQDTALMVYIDDAAKNAEASLANSEQILRRNKDAIIDTRKVKPGVLFYKLTCYEVLGSTKRARNIVFRHPNKSSNGKYKVGLVGADIGDLSNCRPVFNSAQQAVDFAENLAATGTNISTMMPRITFSVVPTLSAATYEPVNTIMGPAWMDTTSRYYNK